MKKKYLSLLLVFTLAVSLLAFGACDGNYKEPMNVSVATPDGAPTLALAEMITDNPTLFDGYSVDYSVVMSDAATEAATVVGAKVVSGEYDMAILPTNLAASLYKKGAAIKLVSANTWGNLFVVSKSAVITDLEELKGKVIYTVSQSGPPFSVIKYLLERKGVPVALEEEYSTEAGGTVTAVAGKVVIKYMPATTMIPSLKQGKIEYGLLGEPAVTNAMAAVGTGANIVLDLQAEWKKLTGDSSYPQASLVANADFIANNKAFVDAFIAKLGGADEWLAVEDNLTEAKAAFVTKAEATSLAKITTATVGRCGVNCVKAIDAKAAVKTYLSVFGITVDDAFFYEG